MHRPRSHLLALLALGVTGVTTAEVPDVSSRQTPVKLPTFTSEPKVISTRDLATEQHIRQQHQTRRK